MTKKDLFDTSKLQNVEWGNIELPGLTDEELHNTNWNHIDGVRNSWNSESGKQRREKYSEITKKANEKRLKDTEYLKKIQETSRDIAKNPERNKKLSKSASLYWNSDTGKTQRSTQQKANWVKHRDSMIQSLKDRYVDGNLNKKISDALRNSDKVKEMAVRHRNEIQTPDGIFESRKAAALHYGIHPTAMNTRMKNHPTLYYYTKIGNGSTGYKNKK